LTFGRFTLVDALFAPTSLVLNGLLTSPDLAVSNVSILTPNASPGQEGTISYAVDNLSTTAATGDWYDSLYLSSDSFLDLNDALLGRVHHTGDVAGLGSYTETMTAPLPGLAQSGYRVLVLADSRGLVPDVNRANNLGFSASSLPVTLPILTVGTPVNGTIKDGEDRYYRLVAAPGQDLTISAQYSAATEAELYVRYGAIPDRTDFDVTAENYGDLNPKLSLTNTQGGDYYILLHGREGAGTGQSFTLSAAAAQFQLLKITPERAVTQGPQNIRLSGTKFTPQTTVSLLASDSTTYTPTSVFFIDSGHLEATFDFSAIPVGSYAVRAQDGGQTSIASTALQVTAEIVGGVPGTIFYAPQYVRVGAPIGVTVEINAGVSTVPVPLVVVDATNVAGDAHQQLIDPQLPRFLLPGQKAQFTLTFDPSPKQAHTISEFQLSLVELRQVIDWDGQKNDLRPPGVSAEAWDAVWANLRPRLGGTVGDFYTLLGLDGAALNNIGVQTTRINRLFSFEIKKANNEFPFPILDTAVDLASPAPGMPFAFARSFQSTVVGRYNLGRLGRGWVDSLDVAAVTDSSGLVTIRMGAVTRYFTRLADGSFAGPEGENGTLTLVNGSYQLHEQGGGVTAFRSDGLLDYVQDTNNNRMTAGYTGGRLASLTHSNGASMLLSYNAQGRLSQVTDPDGHVATYAYDASGEHLLSVTTPGGTVQYTYTSETSGPRAHAMTSMTSPGGQHLFYAYDAQGRLSHQERDGGAEAVSFTYGTNSYRITDAQNHATTLFFDDQGLIRAVKDALGNYTYAGYDEARNPIFTINPGNGLQQFFYDGDDNLTRSIDTMGATQRFEYEPVFSRLVNWQDALQHGTSFAYDARGNLVLNGFADGTTQQYQYDTPGNVAQTVNRQGQEVTYTYDQRGLLLKMQFTDGSQVNYTYDSRANMISATDARGTIVMQYDAADRMTKITYPNGRFLQYSYDAGGRRTQTVDQAGFTINYSYDAAGRLVRLTDGGGNLITQYTYDAVGQLARNDDGNDTYTTYEYDASGRLLKLINCAADNSILSSFEYMYDSLGRRTSMTALDGTTTYGYDAVGRLTSVTLPDTRTITYQYDAAGNRVAVFDNGVAVNYTTNHLNQYTSAGGTNYTYDLNGNLVAASGPNGMTSYTYDALGRVVGVTNASGTWRYEYDALGNRVAMAHNGVRTEYLIDPLGLGNVVGEYDGAGQLLAHYTHGLGLASRVDPSNTASYYDFDAVGSAVGLTGPTGSYVNRYSYLPFGEVLSALEGVPNPFEYVGALGVQNDGNGLSFMRARFYDPSQGRFIQPDPIGLAGGTNLYVYVENDPVDLADPSGLTPSGALILLGEVFFGMNLSNSIALGNTMSILDAATSLSQGNWSAPPASPGAGLGTGGAGFRAANANALLNRIGTNGGVSQAEARAALQAIRAQRAAQIAAQLRGPVAGPATQITAGFLTVVLAVEFTVLFQTGVTFAQFFFTGTLPECVGIPGEQALGFCEYPTITGNLAAKAQTEQVSPVDPNFISGPAGFGPENFIVGDGLWPYLIGYENKASASAPAQQVVITQQLDPDLDLSTFQLGDFGFGDLVVDVPEGRQVYNSRIDYRAERGVFVDVTAELDIPTRTATWTLTSIDPATLDLPFDVMTGFLPPNVTAPQGDGYVSYFVRPQANLTTGATVDAQASIVFDTNDAIDTNLFLNTIDAGAPSSNVAALPAETYTPSFTLNWAGADDAGGPAGSGIASYDVFVSDNGGAFTSFLTGTTEASALFTGQDGHTYQFYSVATDNVGHREAASVTADAVTVVRLAKIQGLAFEDVNVDGIRNGGEAVMTGRTLFLDGNSNGVLDAGELITLSDAGGAYGFGNLAPGTYHLAEVLPAGWFETTPVAARTVVITGGETVIGRELGSLRATLDVDGDGDPNSTDGRVILRYLAGVPDSQLTAGILLSAAAPRPTGTQIRTYLDGAKALIPSFLDVDGNGQLNPFTDGRLIQRYLANAGDSALLAGSVLGPGATRTTVGAIRDYLDQFRPFTNLGTAGSALSTSEAPVLAVAIGGITTATLAPTVTPLVSPAAIAASQLGSTALDPMTVSLTATRQETEEKKLTVSARPWLYQFMVESSAVPIEDPNRDLAVTLP
jgi:RHS repeat-associated protein